MHTHAYTHTRARTHIIRAVTAVPVFGCTMLRAFRTVSSASSNEMEFFRIKYIHAMVLLREMPAALKFAWKQNC